MKWLLICGLMMSGLLAPLLDLQPAGAATVGKATVLCQGGPFTSRSNQIQEFSQVFNVSSEQAGQPITVRFTNGGGSRKFAWMRAFLNAGSVTGQPALLGRKIINEYSFRNGDLVNVDLTGLLRAGANTIAIQGAGLPGASCSFQVTSQGLAAGEGGGGAALSLSSVEPDEIAPGGSITVHGTGFSEMAKKDTVTIYNRPCTVDKASATELTVTTPAGLAPHSYTVDVTVNGVKSNSLKFDVTGPPELGSSSLQGFVPGSQVEITGNNFCKVASKNIVTIEVFDLGIKKTCSVVASTKQTMTITVPDFPEMTDRIQGGVATPATLTLTVNGVKASGSLSILISIRPMVR